MTPSVQDNKYSPNDQWFDDYIEESDDVEVVEYDITASPNDFNISTLFSFIESGAVIIPGFQRNYVWDIKRASKLIESLILGLPVPQIFLYEEGRNRFLVIDGQQRLMSIYYFIKQRFPRNNVRTELRSVFEKYGKIPDEVLQVAPHVTVVRYACNANGGPDILLLVRSPTLLGGASWTPPRHSVPIGLALPEGKRARATSASIRARPGASSARSVAKRLAPLPARSSIGCAPRQRRWSLS
jgi:hypothetical protein